MLQPEAQKIVAVRRFLKTFFSYQSVDRLRLEYLFYLFVNLRSPKKPWHIHEAAVLTLFYMGFWRYVNTWGGIKTIPPYQN